MPRKRLAEDGVVLPDVNHGTPGAYNAGCRCTTCRTTNRERVAAYRARVKEDEAACAPWTRR